MYTIKGISRNPNVIEPIPGYSAEMMLRQCNLLAGIVNSTEEVKVGRGKKAFMKKVLKYTTEPRIAKSINDSVEFYKNLMEKRKPQIKLRDYQKKIATESSILLM